MSAFLSHEDKKLKLASYYKSHKKGMYNVAFSILKDPSKAEDVVHDSFIKIFDIIKQIDETNEVRLGSFF